MSAFVTWYKIAPFLASVIKVCTRPCAQLDMYSTHLRYACVHIYTFISTLQDGFSPLYVASQKGRTGVVESMMKNGVDPNQSIKVY